MPGLLDGELEISNNAAMCDHAVEFNKSLFGEEPRENIRLGGDFWQEGGKLGLKKMNP
jgi:hypothetical protein